MNLFTISCTYLKRKKSKTIILGIILLLLGTVLVSLVGIRSSLWSKVVSPQGRSIYLVSKNGGSWPKEAFNAIKDSDITENLYGIREAQEKADVKYVASEGIDHNYLSLSLVAYSDSDNIQAFKEKRLSVVEGKMVTNDDRDKVLVHQVFAEQNQLKVGSILVVKGRQVEVIGIFKPTNGNEVFYQNRNLENTLITNDNLMSSLYQTSGYSTLVLRVNNAKIVQSAISSMKQWGVDWSKLDVKSASEFHGEAYKNILTVYSLVNRIVLLVAIFSMTLLSVILKRWVNNRIRETGVLLALGKSKIEIIGRYLIEVGIVSTTSFTVSIFMGLLIGQKLFTTLIEQVNGGISHVSAQESPLYVSAFKNLAISIGIQDSILLYLIGTFICFGAVILSTYSIIKLKPKEILTMMS